MLYNRLKILLTKDEELECGNQTSKYNNLIDIDRTKKGNV